MPDEAVQSQIEKAMKAYRTVDGGSWESQRRAYDEEIRLHVLVEGDNVRLARQLIYYSLHPRSETNGETFLVVFALASISDSALLEGVLPYLDLPDLAMRKRVQGFLKGIEKHDGPNYETYGACLQGMVDSPPSSLIEYMYRKAPGEALRACEMAFSKHFNDKHNIPREQRIATRQAVLWASHVVADILWQQENGFVRSDETTPEALEQLATLSAFDQWWVRLYVAEILRSEPEFQTDGVVAALRQDAHPLVRKTIEEAVVEKREREKAEAEREIRKLIPVVTLPSRQICPVVRLPLSSEETPERDQED